MIREVWANNLEAEMAVLRDLVEKYPYISMDTEFPGVVARPIGNFKTSSDYQYQTLRCNVDLLKIIQLGITFTDELGNMPSVNCTWQFNFKFNLSDDMYAQDSIELLTKSGIDFKKHEEYGIEVEHFGELLISSGFVLVDEVKWVSFHSGYDFGYLLKVVTCLPLPAEEIEFFELLKLYFPCVYDIKYLMKSCKSLKGGLQDVADDMQIARIGPQHQAGSDSLLTAKTFFKMRDTFFDSKIDEDKYMGYLYDLAVDPNDPPTPKRGYRTMASAVKNALAKSGFRKPDIHILLRENVPGLGNKGYARNYLIPFKLAYFVPRSKGKPILPEGWRPKVKISKEDIITIVPATFNMELLRPQTIGGGDKAKSGGKLDQAAINTLSRIGKLTFARPVISAGDTRIFGSVSVDDCVAELQEKHGITLESKSITIEGGRIKELGVYQATVNAGRDATIALDVEVIAECCNRVEHLINLLRMASLAPLSIPPLKKLLPDTEEHLLKGGHALRKLKTYCDELYSLNKTYYDDIGRLEQQLKKLSSQRQNLELEIQEKNEKIAKLKQHEFEDDRATRTRKEIEQLLLHETQQRIILEAEIKDLKKALEKTQQEYEDLKISIAQKADLRKEQEQTIAKQGTRIVDLEKAVKNYEFEIDELKVALIKHEQRSEELEKSMIQVAQKNEFLSQMESTFREENTALQKRLRELIDANKEVTNNYQAIKKNHELKRSEFDELATELEEAKTACQLAIRQKKQMGNDLGLMMKQRQEMSDKNKAMENLLARKEKDIADLLTKVNDTINDYELKLERKEEQMWAMSLQMSEESQKNRNHINIDPDFINDIEKKWQAKEKNLQAEIDRLSSLIKSKDESINNLSTSVADLQKKQFQPRMERLKAIEKDIKSRMEEYALAEERMETGFLCPRDLQCFKIPMTLIPCGHTYCKGCIESLKEENYNVIKCQVCNVPVEHVFRNEQLEAVGEQFARRKTLTLSFLEWIKMLKVYLPDS
ncbi:hypothetical protein HDV05_006322 [Chytridiales sp. JEL 0842]|nr:hypothetical protein HDV05_006322 [Chytridiales sp. JEL 0842]